jgi:hypothetical protein
MLLLFVILYSNFLGLSATCLKHNESGWGFFFWGGVQFVE